MNKKQTKILKIAVIVLVLFICAIGAVFILNNDKDDTTTNTQKEENTLNKSKNKDTKYFKVSNKKFYLSGINGSKLYFYVPYKPTETYSNINTSAYKFKSKNGHTFYLMAKAGYNENIYYDMELNDIKEYTDSYKEDGIKLIKDFQVVNDKSTLEDENPTNDDITYATVEWKNDFAEVSNLKDKNIKAYKTNGSFNWNDKQYNYFDYELNKNFSNYSMNSAIQFIVISEDAPTQEIDDMVVEIINTLSIQ